MMLGIVAAMLLGACLRGWHGKRAPLDRKELARHRRASEEKCRDWMYPFE
jgi:hypothetical protein